MKTRADMLRFAVYFALGKLRFKHAPHGLPEESRAKLADDVLRGVQQFGGWKELDNPATIVEDRPVSPF